MREIKYKFIFVFCLSFAVNLFFVYMLGVDFWKRGVASGVSMAVIFFISIVISSMFCVGVSNE
jgi:hypothetical protein